MMKDSDILNKIFSKVGSMSSDIDNMKTDVTDIKETLKNKVVYRTELLDFKERVEEKFKAFQNRYDLPRTILFSMIGLIVTFFLVAVLGFFIVQR